MEAGVLAAALIRHLMASRKAFFYPKCDYVILYNKLFLYSIIGPFLSTFYSIAGG